MKSSPVNRPKLQKALVWEESDEENKKISSSIEWTPSKEENFILYSPSWHQSYFAKDGPNRSTYPFLLVEWGKNKG